MSQPLPVKDFKWVSPDEIDILNVPKDNKLGYILEVDLKYPKELHDKHNLYPLHLNMYRLLMICSHLFSEDTFHVFAVLYGNTFQIFTIKRSM